MTRLGLLLAFALLLQFSLADLLNDSCDLMYNCSSAFGQMDESLVKECLETSVKAAANTSAYCYGKAVLVIESNADLAKLGGQTYDLDGILALILDSGIYSVTLTYGSSEEEFEVQLVPGEYEELSYTFTTTGTGTSSGSSGSSSSSSSSGGGGGGGAQIQPEEIELNYSESELSRDLIEKEVLSEGVLKVVGQLDLEKTVEKTIEARKHARFTRRVKYVTSGQAIVGTSYELEVEFDRNVDNIVIVETIPKSFASSASQIQYWANKGTLVVIKEDPVFSWHIPLAQKGEKLVASFTVSGERPYYQVMEIINSMDDPILVSYEKEEKPFQALNETEVQETAEEHLPPNEQEIQNITGTVPKKEANYLYTLAFLGGLVALLVLITLLLVWVTSRGEEVKEGRRSRDQEGQL